MLNLLVFNASRVEIMDIYLMTFYAKVLINVKLRFRRISACTRLRDSVKFSFFSNMAERLANNGQKWMKIGKIHPCIYSKKFRGVVF